MKLGCCLWVFCVTWASAQDWPTHLSFIGLTNQTWQLYLVLPNQLAPTPVETAVPLIEATFSPQQQMIAYIAVDGTVREKSLVSNKERVLLKPSKDRTYAQPHYLPNGQGLLLVALKQGNSVDTDILLRTNQGKLKTVIQQRSAQFQPYAASQHDLYYTNVTCTVGCGRIIQDIWHKHLITQQAMQLTRINAIAQNPTVDSTQQWLYYSANTAGNYHLWRLSLSNHSTEQLTRGQVTDLNPTLDQHGNLFFIRRQPQGSAVMQLNLQTLALTTFDLPDGVQNSRNLEIH